MIDSTSTPSLGALSSANLSTLGSKPSGGASPNPEVTSNTSDSIGSGKSVASDRLRDAATGVSNVAKGLAADSKVPQKYRFKAVKGTTSNAMIVDTTKGKTRPSSTKPVGTWVVRSDAPHTGAPTPHINVNKRLTGVPDPHTPISGGAYKAIGIGARALEAADRVAVPVAVGVDAIRLGAAYHEDGNKVGTNTVHTAGSVSGGWIGAAAGAAAGAQAGVWVGGTIGAIAGGVGAVPGAAIGGVVGGIAGALGGSAVGERAADALSRHK